MLVCRLDLRRSAPFVNQRIVRKKWNVLLGENFNINVSCITSEIQSEDGKDGEQSMQELITLHKVRADNATKRGKAVRALQPQQLQSCSMLSGFEVCLPAGRVHWKYKEVSCRSLEATMFTMLRLPGNTSQRLQPETCHTKCNASPKYLTFSDTIVAVV